MNQTERKAARNRVKEKLRQYRDALAEVKRLDREIELLEDQAYYPHSPNLDGMPHGGAGGDAMLKYIAKKEAMTQSAYENRTKSLMVLSEIKAAIAELPDKQKEVITLRYIEGHKWEKICDLANYEWAQVHRLHAAALDQLIPVFGSKE